MFSIQIDMCVRLCKDLKNTLIFEKHWYENKQILINLSSVHNHDLNISYRSPDSPVPLWPKESAKRLGSLRMLHMQNSVRK